MAWALNAAPERDCRLVQQVLNGHAEAFDELLAPYRRKLLLLIVRVVKNPCDADDVLQDALLRIYRGLHNFRGDACFYTWSYRIALNCALAFLARRNRMLADASHAQEGYRDGAWEASASDDPENVLAGKQMATIVDAALESMRPEYKAAIELREFEGLSYHEIADAMVCPVGTVKSRISSARSAIAHQLKQQGVLGHGRGL